MLTIEEIRKRYPQYKDISDERLLEGFHKKFYSNIPREEFFSKFNMGQQPQQQGHGWIRGNLEDILSAGKRHAENIADLGMGFKGGVEKLTHGVIQPLAERGYLGSNVQQGFRPMVERNAQELQAAQERSPVAAGIGNLAGMLGVRAPAYALSGGSIPALGALGAAYGGASLPEQGESRLDNARNEALTEMLLPGALKVGGKVASTAVKAAQKAVPAAVKAIKNPPKAYKEAVEGTKEYVKSFSGENNVNKILTDKAAAKAKYKGEYGDIFKSAEEAGIKKVAKPNIKTDDFFKNSLREYNTSLSDFMKNPTLENAHWAQSDLGKYINTLKNAKNKLPSEKIKALDQAVDIRDRLKEEIVSALNKSKGLGPKYHAISEGYKKDVIPYENSILDRLNPWHEKRASKKTVSKLLAKNEKFNLDTEFKYPELQRSLLLSDMLGKAKKKAPYAVAAGALGYGLGKSRK